MSKCRKCNGEGYEWIDEDSYVVQHPCYHCGTSGEVDEETDFHDRLMSVANTLAYQQESEYRKWCDSDPDGDGYDLHAAENMMRTSDYFLARVYERQYDIAEQLSKLPLPSQEVLVAWNEEAQVSLCARFNQSVKAELEAKQELKEATAIFGDDDIPF
jgi:hypothetical protein